MDPHPHPIINEVDRAVLKLPDDATIYRSAYLPLAFDASGNGSQATPTLLSRAGRGIEYQAQYEIFCTLCGDRAQKTIDGELVVGGQAIAPEKYLRLWRHAIKLAQSPEALYDDHGLVVIATLRAPLAHMAGKRSTWACCPFQTFDAFWSKYGSPAAVGADGVFTLHLDLREPDAARDAYYGASMLTGAFGHRSMSWAAGIGLHASRTPPAQNTLFVRADLVEA